MFKLVSNYLPSGDQPHAIDELVDGINKGKKNLNTNPSTLFSHIEPGRDLLTI